MARYRRLAFACSMLAFICALTPGRAAAQEEGEEIMPLPASREELADRLTEAGLSAAGVAAIVAVARDGLALDTAPADEATLPLGASKIGGRPDLPRQVEWPVRPAYDDAAALQAQFDTEAANLYADAGIAPPWMPKAEAETLLAERQRAQAQERAAALQIMREAGTEVDEKDLDAVSDLPPGVAKQAAAEQRALAQAVGKPMPLAFIAQIDLAALSRQPGFDPAMPNSGRLLFFYDMPVLPASYEPRAKAGWRLIYDDSPAEELERKPLPPLLAAFPGTVSLKPAAVSPRQVTTTVPVGDAGWDTVGAISGDDVSLYSQWLFTIGWPTAPQGGNHQLAGWPRAIQSGMQATSQLAANGIDAGVPEAFSSDEGKRLLEKAREWRLVLQVGTDPATGYPFPGALYVLMRDEDLAARRFDRAWVVYEQD